MDVKDLIGKLVKQGFCKAALRNKFVKFCRSKLNVWGKFGKDLISYESSMFDQMIIIKLST